MQSVRSVFLYLPEETFGIRLRLGLSKANVIAFIDAISGFRFYERVIRKSSFAKIGSCELNENHGSLFAE